MISTLAVDAHKDRAALLDHVDTLQTALDVAHEAGLDILAHRDQLAGQVVAVRELVTKFEAQDVMPAGQVALLRATLDGTPPDPPDPPTYLEN